MAIVRDSNATSARIQPRVSTPEPVGVERWDNTQLDLTQPDLAQFFTQGKWSEQPKESVGLQSLSLDTSGGSLTPLSLSSLSLGSAPKASDWLTAYQPLPTYTAGTLDKAGLNSALQGSQTGSQTSSRSGGYGMSAYGFSGTTGLDWQKGKAAYGFQTGMWGALSKVNQAMQAAGLGRLRITDGFRSYNAQVDVKKRKGNLAATPGRSIHGLGLAADLDLTGSQLKWLKKNGARYGLINLPSESWHWQLAPSLWKGSFDRKRK